MIRPFTIVTCLLACGSGLYLYQSKHEVQLLDRTIERTAHETAALREQSRLLATEWTMLNDPERLRRFANAYLSLKTITPSQFTNLAELGTRLPPPRAEAAPAGTSEPGLIPLTSEAAPSAAPAGAPPVNPGPGPAANTVETEPLPVPPVPAPSQVQAVASTTRSAEPSATRPAEPKTSVADAKPQDQRQHPSEQHAVPRVAEAHMEVRLPVAPQPANPPLVARSPRPIVLAPPRPLPVVVRSKSEPLPSRSAMGAPPANDGGSLLGMAHGVTPPAPRPTPVNATYNAN